MYFLCIYYIYFTFDSTVEIRYLEYNFHAELSKYSKKMRTDQSFMKLKFHNNHHCLFFRQINGSQAKNILKS